MEQYDKKRHYKFKNVYTANLPRSTRCNFRFHPITRVTVRKSISECKVNKTFIVLLYADLSFQIFFLL